MKLFNRYLLTTIFFLAASIGIAQERSDTIETKVLNDVTIQGNRISQDYQIQKPVSGTYIFMGKKTEVIDLSQKDVAITEKYGRQIFAKVPGIFVYDMDGTGNQVNISARGLDPHRGWEFNVRKDGMVTNSDMYGYPASHYNIPMEAVERVELVRGTGSLQYGAQFGGMINYVSKQPDTTRQLSFESVNTIGSYGLVSTFNGASGKMGKFRYSTWLNKKWLTGYRDNGDSQYDAAAVSLFYDATRNLTFKLEWTKSNYVIHLSGPLTDQMFRDNPRQSTRSRNYYNPNIHVPSFQMDWRLSERTQVQFTTSAVIGARNSVMFDQPATVADTIRTMTTKQYNNRQVDIDHFNSYTSELRVVSSYGFMGNVNIISAGVQYMNNDLHRQQQGRGTTGSDFDLTRVIPEWGRDLHYKTSNIAAFVENKWALSPRLSVNTGARMEMGETNMIGTISYYAAVDVPNNIEHRFPLLGINAQYKVAERINFYGGWSQAYRPVIFKDIIPASVYEISDKNLKDAYGDNTELGFRGKWRFLTWDITGFLLRYNNRLGTVAQTNSSGQLIIFRTNIGDSQTKGLEFFMQGDFALGTKSSVSLFTSTSYMDARYHHASVRSGNENVNVNGHKVESTPAWISRNGTTWKYGRLGVSVLYSYTAESFADALNSREPNATGATGLVPAYGLVDTNIAIRFNEKLKVQFNVNNLFDEHYFTKRPQFYPGPGIWPSDGRTMSGTVSLRI